MASMVTMVPLKLSNSSIWGGEHSLRQINNARRGGRLSPSHVINARAAAGVFPHRHLWRGGGRQAGGEVIPRSRVQASRSRNREPFSCRS